MAQHSFIHSLGPGDSCSLPLLLSLKEELALCVAWLKGQWEEIDLLDFKGMIC